MIENYLKVARRNFLKTRLFSTINLLGLSIGMASFLLILQVISFEFSYDNFHKNKDNICRLYYSYNNGSSNISVTGTPAPMGPFLKKDWPEVVDYVRISPWGEGVAKYQEMNLRVDGAYIADASFFRVFFISVAERGAG